MRIGQLAAQAGHSVRTIRFYEQSGLLPTPDRTSGGYRDYDQDAVTRLRFVRAEGEPLGLPVRACERRDIAVCWGADARSREGSVTMKIDLTVIGAYGPHPRRSRAVRRELA